MQEDEAYQILQKYIVEDRETNLPNPIHTKEDVEAIIEALKIVSPDHLEKIKTALEIIKLSYDLNHDYSKCKYKLELRTLSDKENKVLTDFLKKNLPKTAETYGSAAVRMIYGEQSLIPLPQDVDIQLHVKDEKLAEDLAQKACDALNKLSFLHTKFEVDLHDPRICLVPSKTRRSVVRLKSTKEPVLDIHTEGEQGSIPKSSFGYERLPPVLIEGMNVSPAIQNQIDLMASINTLRRR